MWIFFKCFAPISIFANFGNLREYSVNIRSFKVHSEFYNTSVIGSGSFGTCYKVQRKKDNQIFVWKAIDYGDLSEEKKELLVTEVNLLRSIRHPNVVRYYGYIIHKESTTLYVVMEFCANGDLANLVHTSRRTTNKIQEGFIWRVLYQLTNALKALQDQGILHRDVKPANVFLDEDFNVKLGDFGLAKDTAQQKENRGHAESFVGTPGYMSPEVFRGDRYDGKSDVWSLGCVTYELCALRGPFTGRNMRQLSRHVTTGRYEPIPNHYSPELHRIIDFMLTVNTSIRPDIRAILHHPSVVSQCSQSTPPFLPSTQNSTEKDLSERENLLRMRELALEEKERKIRERENKIQPKPNLDLDSSAGLGDSPLFRPTTAKLNPFLVPRPLNFPAPVRKVRFEKDKGKEVTYKWYEIDPPFARPLSELGQAPNKPKLPEKPSSDGGRDEKRGKYSMLDLERAVQEKFVIGKVKKDKENIPIVKHTML